MVGLGITISCISAYKFKQREHILKKLLVELKVDMSVKIKQNKLPFPLYLTLDSRGGDG